MRWAVLLMIAALLKAGENGWAIATPLLTPRWWAPGFIWPAGKVAPDRPPRRGAA